MIDYTTYNNERFIVRGVDIQGYDWPEGFTDDLTEAEALRDTLQDAEDEDGLRYHVYDTQENKVVPRD